MARAEWVMKFSQDIRRQDFPEVIFSFLFFFSFFFSGDPHHGSAKWSMHMMQITIDSNYASQEVDVRNWAV